MIEPFARSGPTMMENDEPIAFLGDYFLTGRLTFMISRRVTKPLERGPAGGQAL